MLVIEQYFSVLFLYIFDFLSKDSYFCTLIGVPVSITLYHSIVPYMIKMLVIEHHSSCLSGFFMQKKKTS